MNKNYFNVAIRYLLRHKGYTIINLLGLAVGIAACLLIMLFVKSELSYDKFNTKSERLYRVWLEEKEDADKVFVNTVTPLPLGAALQRLVPEIENSCRIYSTEFVVSKAGEVSKSENIQVVDKSFFKMFDFKLNEGNPDNPFPTVNSIILTSETAKRIFGKESPIGKVLQVKFDNGYFPYIVNGIVDNVPVESSIRFDMLISFDNESRMWSENAMKAWHQVYPETYVLLKDHVSVAAVSNKMDGFAKQILPKSYKKGTYNLFFQPITDIHLNNDLPEGIQPISSPIYSYILSIIGILILLIACVNFITLSIGRSVTRAMEVGIRKVLGADRKQIMHQFWVEAFIFTMTSLVIGFIIAVIFISPFNTLFQRNLTMHFDFALISFCICLVLFIAFVAGSYPALILSGFNPTEVFKRKNKSSGKKNWLRQGLIAGQFVCSIALIICTIVISRQLQYIQQKNLGYQKEQIIIVPTNKEYHDAIKTADIFKNELRKEPRVKSVSTSLYSFAENQWIDMGYEDNSKKYRRISMNEIDENFIPTMNIQMVSGRNFSKDNSADFSSGMIVNEALVREYGWKDPIGQLLPGKTNLRVIGVVKDFNFQSLHSEIGPLVLTMRADSVKTDDVNIAYSPRPRISVRFAGGNVSENIELLRKTWKSIESAQNFEYVFLNERLAAQYDDELRTGKIILVASSLSIFIACIGLFGITTLIVTRRTKEIGIRKILGAHYINIIALISQDFVIVVGIASIVAFPLAYWAMNKWLQNFAYRVEVSWWIMLISSMIVLLIVLGTVGIQALKAALTNPVKSLRTE